MDIEYAIKELRDSYELHQLAWAKRCLDTIEDELEKKDKIIDLMAYDLMHIGSIPYRENIFTKEQLIEQYVNKVEEDKK